MQDWDRIQMLQNRAIFSENPMAFSITEIDARLLDHLQEAIPLVERPFLQIGQKLGLNEQEVIERVTALKSKTGGVIRQISAIFDSRALGYESCLVAAKVDESRIDEAAAEVSNHPGVSHNYRRNHNYNLWYTLAVPPDSQLGLQKTLDILHARSGASVTRLMPALKMYKIGVKFSLSGDADAPALDAASGTHRPAPAFHATPRDKQLIRLLQQDLPVLTRPFDAFAESAGIDVGELLADAQRYIETGVMRRFSVVLRHREAGFSANAMGAWVVPGARHDEFGAAAAQFPQVSHCYLRPTYDDWPYSLFTMVHGTSSDECERVLSDISRRTNITDYRALYSTHEYKKVRVKYFTPEIGEWEKRNSRA
jgi:siroheme decarboxylase